MKYRYQAKTQQGELQTGFVESGSKEAALSILSSHNLFILSIEAAETVHFYDRVAAYFGRVRSKDMVIFTRQLAMLLQAQLPLSKALETLHRQTSQPILKQAIEQVIEDVDAGLAFSQALERQTNVFSDFFVSMIRSSETTGNLNDAVEFLANYTEKEYALASKTVAALTYPAILVGLFIVVATILLTFVFPQIGPIFESSGVQLPVYTRVLLALGKFFQKWWFVVIALALVLGTMFLNYLATAEGKGFLDDFKIRAPIIKKIFVPLSVTRFSNAMSILLRGGIPVAQALEIVSHTVDNVVYRDVFHDISNVVRQGEQLSQAITRYPEFFPELVPQMLVVGETTGRLDQVLSQIALFYTRETDQVLNSVVDLIQPVLMVTMGVMVAFLFAAILLPLYQLTATIH